MTFIQSHDAALLTVVYILLYILYTSIITVRRCQAVYLHPHLLSMNRLWTHVVCLCSAVFMVTAVEIESWPGYDNVTSVDLTGYFLENLSGLSYQPVVDAQPAVLWAVQNYPSVLYKMHWNGAVWVSVDIDGWSNGKTLKYSDGSGEPDAEDLTKPEWDSNLVYICTERNGHESVPRFSVLMYELDGDATILNATMEWNLTADFIVVNSNLGFEGITWVPDDFLVLNGFMDMNTGSTYDPTLYPNHGSGLLFLGYEADGFIYAYSLNTNDGSYQRIASFSSGSDHVMSLSFDRDTGYLWSMCDNNCDGEHHVHYLDNSTGQFLHVASYARPSSMGGNYDTEGFTTTPESACDENGQKLVAWADDSADDGHSIRQDTIPCGQFVDLSSLADDEDGVKDIDVWTDEQVSLLLAGVMLGCMTLAAGVYVLYRHKFPPPVKQKTRLQPSTTSLAAPKAKISKEGPPHLQGVDITRNPMASDCEAHMDGNDLL